jgi:hypothetical protein
VTPELSLNSLNTKIFAVSIIRHFYKKDHIGFTQNKKKIPRVDSEKYVTALGEKNANQLLAQDQHFFNVIVNHR